MYYLNLLLSPSQDNLSSSLRFVTILKNIAKDLMIVHLKLFCLYTINGINVCTCVVVYRSVKSLYT